MSDFSDEHTLRDGVREIKQPSQDILEVLRPVPGAPSVTFQTTGPFWRRLWFVVSCIPRYLITGSVEVP